jgi:hypothetical protein
MATIELSGSNNGLIKYVGDYTTYIKLTSICLFKKANSNRVHLVCGGYHTELEFDDEAQRDAAITTLLTWY